MELLPLRLRPGQDLKPALQAWVEREAGDSAWIVSGIGSLAVARLRLAGHTEPSVVNHDMEILTLQGSVCRDGCHLHITVADANGMVLGGHLCEGSLVRTTAEVLIAQLPHGQLQRTLDPTTGYRELAVQPQFRRSHLLRWLGWCSRQADS